MVSRHEYNLPSTGLLPIKTPQTFKPLLPYWKHMSHFHSQQQHLQTFYFQVLVCVYYKYQQHELRCVTVNEHAKKRGGGGESEESALSRTNRLIKSQIAENLWLNMLLKNPVQLLCRIQGVGQRLETQFSSDPKSLEGCSKEIILESLHSAP